MYLKYVLPLLPQGFQSSSLTKLLKQHRLLNAQHLSRNPSQIIPRSNKPSLHYTLLPRPALWRGKSLSFPSSWCLRRNILNSQEVSNIGWQLLNHSVVEPLDILEHALIILGDKIDGHTLASKSSTTTNTVEVVLRLGG